MAESRDIATELIDFKEPNMVGVCHAPVLHSIESDGIKNPLLVVRRGERYQVWIGNQRLAAARYLGITEVPCVVVESREDVDRELAQYKEIDYDCPRPAARRGGDRA